MKDTQKGKDTEIQEGKEGSNNDVDPLFTVLTEE